MGSAALRLRKAPCPLPRTAPRTARGSCLRAHNETAEAITAPSPAPRRARALRLPTELEAEFAARGGIIDEPFPWGGDEAGGTLNGWTGPFPAGNTAADGYAATAPVDAFAPNGFGLYNTVGNVWEWASGGSAPKRPLRGGSFIDSLDGLINHPLRVSTRMDNAGDSGSFNIGFRCAAGDVPNPAPGEGMDQATLAGIVEREGVEGLTAYLAARGKGTQVLSAKDAVVELKSKKARLEAELSALDRDET